ncbi:MAG: hypothetical protein ACTH07_06475 [Microbacterium sp.]
MSTQGPHGFPADLLEQLRAHANVLGIIDESQDIALELHRTPFAPDVRKRAAAFLDSTRYRNAAQQFEALAAETPSEQCTGEEER